MFSLDQSFVVGLVGLDQSFGVQYIFEILNPPNPPHARTRSTLTTRPHM